MASEEKGVDTIEIVFKVALPVVGIIAITVITQAALALLA